MNCGGLSLKSDWIAPLGSVLPRYNRVTNCPLFLLFLLTFNSVCKIKENPPTSQKQRTFLSLHSRNYLFKKE